MFNNKTNELIQKLLADAPVMIGEASLRHDIDDLVLKTLPKMRFAIVDDVNTSLAFGDNIFAALKGFNESIHVTLKDGIEADDETVTYIQHKTHNCDALVAVGGGTISDLCKYVAHLDGKPYIVFPTAASMNGYLSANASITVNGHKTTLPAKLPAAVFCDFSVITSAPVRLAKSGLGDCLARPTAQADWLLSHLLLGTNYKQEVYDLILDIEPELFADAGGIAKNDLTVVRKLTELLLLSGLGMTIAGGSYPASQGEHMIAHAYGMLKHSQKTLKTLHGEEIGVTSLYMAKLQEKLLQSKPKTSPVVFDKYHLTELYGEKLTDEFAKEYDKKSGLLRSASNNRVNWDNIREKIEPIIIKSTQMENIIKKAQLIASTQALGWGDSDYNTACETARFTRDRFTFLDLIY